MLTAATDELRKFAATAAAEAFGATCGRRRLAARGRVVEVGGEEEPAHGIQVGGVLDGHLRSLEDGVEIGDQRRRQRWRFYQRVLNREMDAVDRDGKRLLYDELQHGLRKDGWGGGLLLRGRRRSVADRGLQRRCG